MNITELPDYPSLLQLVQALWGSSEIRGAAVLVGAGYSRNAVLPSPHSSLPPLWSDFHSAMCKQLYPSGGAPQDPLRLAQEFKVTFGDSALNNLIRDKVQDDTWVPGELHDRLLRLPWADVLTTNWDTLLERSAQANNEREYDVVYTSADIARTRSPRIVKLHGSLPSNTPLIFTEDDFRTYPTSFAPFVNLAKQILLENEILLLGFSGDDPNFLQWTGWVRDQLGPGSRRIYLAGLLGLSLSSRKLLESRGVIPIDLSPLFEKKEVLDKYKLATSELLNFIHSSKPIPSHRWPSVVNIGSVIEMGESNPVKSDLSDKLKALISQRKTYPGWIICPAEKRRGILQTSLETQRGLLSEIGNVPIQQREQLIFEIVWIFDLTFYIPSREFQLLMAEACTRQVESGLTKQQRLAIALSLLKCARVVREPGEFFKWGEWLESECGDHTGMVVEAKYEKCLWARDTLNYLEVANTIKGLVGEDPVWGMRKASLYCELGDFAAARKELESSSRALRSKSLRDRKSLWIVSRQAWSEYVCDPLKWLSLPGAELPVDGDSKDAQDAEWPLKFRALLCDPWDELQSIDRLIEEQSQGQQKMVVTISPKFDPGAYSSNATTIYHFAQDTSAHHALSQIIDHVGIPRNFYNVNMVGNRYVVMFEAAPLNTLEDILYVIRGLSAADRTTYQGKFSRLMLAKLDSTLVPEVVKILLDGIEFGVNRFAMLDSESQKPDIDSFWVSKVRAYVEILSHFSCRLSSDDAIALFKQGCIFSKDPRWGHWWLFEPLSFLLQRSLTAVEPGSRSTLALEILSIPLPGETCSDGMDRYWPELSEFFDEMIIIRPFEDSEWDRRIQHLLKIAAIENSEGRNRSLMRLCCLHDSRLLTESEQEEFGKALWKNCVENTMFPEDTGLNWHVFLRMPAPMSIDREAKFRSIIFDTSRYSGAYEVNWPVITSVAIFRGNAEPKPCRPNTSQSLQFLKMMLSWQRKDRATSMYDQPDQIYSEFGDALATSILPALNSSDLGPECIAKIFDWIEQDHTARKVRAVSQLVRLDPESERRAAALLQRCLLGRDDGDVRQTVQAVRDWISESELDSVPNLPPAIVRTVVGIVMNRRPQGLEHVVALASLLVQRKLLSSGEPECLIQGLDDLYLETAYEHWADTDMRSHTVSVLRGQCIGLASALQLDGHCHKALDNWSAVSNTDPLPEVRWFLSDAETKKQRLASRGNG